MFEKTLTVDNYIAGYDTQDHLEEKFIIGDTGWYIQYCCPPNYLYQQADSPTFVQLALSVIKMTHCLYARLLHSNLYIKA